VFDQNVYVNNAKLMLKEMEITNPVDNYVCRENRNMIHNYFDDHLSRFIDGILFIEKYVPQVEDIEVLETGSPFPFYTLWFSNILKWKVKCIDISNAGNVVINQNIMSCYGNLCTDDLGYSKYDLMTVCEVWEHLPCNLFRVKEKIIRALKPNGYLLCSYPCGGQNASLAKYNTDWERNVDKSHGHLREFTEETSLAFMYGLKVVDKIMSYPQSYPGGCYTILYVKGE
jgi:hypothetical protein